MSTPNDEARNIRRNRMLWGGCCWVITAILITFGVGYAAGGLHATAAPGAYEVMIRFVPGELHTYGTVLLVLAALMLHGLLPPLQRRPLDDRWLTFMLPVVFGTCILLVWCFAWSWLLSGTKTWQAMAYWGSLGALAALAWRNTPPPSSPNGRGRVA